MKPSIVFDRWIAANAAAIEQDTAAFKKLVAFASLYLKMIEKNRKGVSPGTADAATDCLKSLKAEIDKRGMAAPMVRLPKMKIVRPGVRK
jgi:hypothetical protein